MAHIIKPVTAIRRFEKGEVRDVIGPISSGDGITELRSHIAGQPGVRPRTWRLKDDKILACDVMNPDDQSYNRRKIDKFINRWNGGK